MALEDPKDMECLHRRKVYQQLSKFERSFWLEVIPGEYLDVHGYRTEAQQNINLDAFQDPEERKSFLRMLWSPRGEPQTPDRGVHIVGLE